MVGSRRTSANGDVPHHPQLSAASDPSVKARSQKAVTSFVSMYLVVSAVVAGAWALGYFQFSSVWVFLAIAALFVVWKAKISRIIDEHLQNEGAVLHRKRAFRQDETAEWFNFLLNRWWVFSSANIEELVKKHLDERLWDIRPSVVDSLELTTFSVGEQTPNVKNIRTFECSESTPGKMQPISWFNVHKPPAGLNTQTSYQVVIEADLGLISDDFKMIFRGRVGSSSVNVGFDLVVEDLHLSGTMQAIINFSMDVPFPHISKATCCFIERPDVNFNIRMLRALSLMEIPLVKTWIHNNVMEGLTKSMVDPNSVDLMVKNVGPTLMGQSRTKKEKAQGVLTVHIKGSPPKDAAAEDIRYTVLSMGDRKRQTHEVSATEEWEDVCSFFIYNLATEKIRVKSKCMRLITSTTLEQNLVNLSSFPFQVDKVCETTIEHKDSSKVKLKMEYTALPQIDLATLDHSEMPKASGVAGVLFVCIHGASNVLAADKTGASDPYCVLFCDRKRILTTPFIPRTRNPHWDSWVEFMVADYSRCSLSFFVYDWDGTNTINDDFLGQVHLNLSEAEPEVIRKSMTLGYNKPDEGFTVDKTCGQITVSVIFRPAESVARSERFQDVMKGFKPNDYLYKEDLMSPSSVVSASSRKSTAYVEGLLLDKVIVELTILMGKDMVAMDRNGYSDPFCIVSYQGKKVYTTAVKKKTLFPKWNETLTTEMSLCTPNNELCIDVYDKDIISHDFMGKLVLSLEQLKELSIKGTSDWFTLDKVKTGKVQLKCNVIARDTLVKAQESPDRSRLSDHVFEFPDPMETPKAHNGTRPNHPADVTIASPEESRQAMTDYRQSQAHDHQNRVSGNGTRPSTPPGRPSSNTLVRSSSSNSFTELRHRGEAFSDNKSLVSVNTISEKLYGVTGMVKRIRGDFGTYDKAYCKVYLESKNKRYHLIRNRHTRRIAGSVIVSLTEPTPSFNLAFEIDRGAGVAKSDTLLFDLKHTSKTRVASRGFLLEDLMADADNVCKWIPIGNGIELEVSLTQGAPTPRGTRRSGGLFRSASMRKTSDV